ncbi:PREDICTED: iron-sulfur cluster assembly protein 1-like [Nicotiana attenuata]|uniref:iron-sulfur cluster assembly protein 1-like n=1 Tax=Nicotiana attenuata TaxID=49451 RepID=UPI000904B7B8|nr:PREDICTED: iron-sulfur cluster assembly protein 1-like [Nicotiana attenuata]
MSVLQSILAKWTISFLGDADVITSIRKFNQLEQITKMLRQVGNRIFGLGQRSSVSRDIGCGSAIAPTLATNWLDGEKSVKNTKKPKHIFLPPVKLHSSMFVEDAIKAAVKDYERKKAKFNDKAESA